MEFIMSYLSLDGRRITTWIFLVAFLSLSAMGVQGDTVHLTLSMSPGYNFSGQAGHASSAQVFRERLVAALTRDYACTVVSRSYGMELGQEQALRGLQEKDSPTDLLPAQWVMTPMLTLRERDALEWRIVFTRTDEDAGRLEMVSIPVETGSPLDENYVEAAAAALAESMDIAPRASLDQQILRERIGHVAIMPVTHLTAEPGSEEGVFVSELIETGLQQAGITTVDRDSMQRILKEHSIENLTGATERFSGDLGRLLGADTMLRPVWLSINGAPARLDIHIIDTATGALLGVYGISLEFDDDWISRLSGISAHLLRRPIALPPRSRFGAEALLNEADYHISLVSAVRDNATRSYTTVIDAGIEHATAAYALARQDAHRLSALLQSVDNRLIREHPELQSVYTTVRHNKTPRNRRRIKELIDEVLAQLGFLGALPEQEAYYQMRGHYVAGEYERALRLTDDPGFPLGQRATERAKIFFLMEAYERARAELQRLDAPSNYQLWLLAKCHNRLNRPLEEMQALMASSYGYQSFGRTPIRLMKLLLAHATPDERLENMERPRKRWLLTRPEYYYFAGRTWEDKEEQEKAVDYYRQAQSASERDQTNLITGSLFHPELDKRLTRLGKEGKTGDFKRAADIWPVPDHLNIYIQPMGDGLDATYVETIGETVGWFFGANTIIRPTIPMPMHGAVYSENRNQFDGGALLAMLSRIYPLPPDAYHMVFITREDLYASRQRWVYSLTIRSTGTLLSDRRFQQYVRVDQDVMARGVARAICGGQNFMWKNLVPESTIAAVTGSETWPNSPNSITFSNGHIGGPLTAPGFHYDHDIAALYAKVTPEDVHRSLMENNRERHVDPSRRFELPAEEQEYAETIDGIL